MPEEVTYATVNFPNPPKNEELEDSCSLKRTDLQKAPELELNDVAENGMGRAEGTSEVAESRTVRGLPASWKVWGLIAFILLMLNLVVLAGLTTLVLMNYQNFFSNGTTYDRQQSIIEQLEKNTALYMDIYKNISSEHIIFKNMLENTLKVLNNFISTYHEDLKQKKNDLTLHSCPVSCICHGDCKKAQSFPMNMDNGTNEKRTQQFVKCFSSPASWIDLNCTLSKPNTRLAP